MFRLAIFIFVLSIASVVFLQADAATTQQLSLSSNPEQELTGEWDEANDEEEMNDDGTNLNDICCIKYPSF